MRSCEANSIVPPRTLSADATIIDRWATGPNDYWPSIQIGLTDLPVEMHAVAERLQEQRKRDDDVINDHLDMLIDLLQGYKVSTDEKQRENSTINFLYLEGLVQTI